MNQNFETSQSAGGLQNSIENSKKQLERGNFFLSSNEQIFNETTIKYQVFINSRRSNVIPSTFSLEVGDNDDYMPQHRMKHMPQNNPHHARTR